jgi:tRNA (cytidine/uridine-2'-O-)-methyltransferase
MGAPGEANPKAAVMQIILYEPEIPPNTGNVARLCAGLGLTLHLVGRLGFSLSDKYLKRAGLDYWPYVTMRLWPDWAGFREGWDGFRIIATSSSVGGHFSQYVPQKTDGLLFGPESAGLPAWLLSEASEVFTIPLSRNVRSLNLATSVGFFMGFALSKLDGLS